VVNVSVLTTGFDAPHVDLIAILRKTESVGLLQQIIGRGLRIDPDGRKTDCLILDYTTNLEDHCPDGDLFAPVVKAGKGAGEGGAIPACCPTCDYENAFTANPQYLDCKYDKAGYALDLDGNQIMSEWGPIPVHLGRRCMGLVQAGARGSYERCDYRWTFKPCPHCEAPNDIAARYCSECKGEIVDPNEKLRADFKAFKRDPTQWQTDEVLSMTAKEGVSAKGNKTVRVEWVTPYRQFSTWFSPDSKAWSIKERHEVWRKATEDGEHMPKTVTYRKDPATQFFEIRAYNREADHAPA
jgi:DNA repair protein RadD